jgi:hypothetical protein
MPMFICIHKDKWVPARCAGCDGTCGLSHPTTQEIGTHLWGAGFERTKPAVGKRLSELGSGPDVIRAERVE